MTVDSLIRLLKEKGAHPNAVSVGIGVPRADEMYCLVKDGKRWEVYYAERGEKVDLEVFESEDDACTHLYDILKLDSSVWV
ncbi:hypothetical protein ACW73L_07990 [Methylolobus aquaticus]